MNNHPRQILRQILAKYGKEICSDARRCEGLLNDLSGSYRREINVMVNAIEERIPLDLLAGAGSMPMEVLLTRLEKRLEDQTAMTREAARWTVESWALGLGVATDAEIKERARKQSAPPSPKAEKIQPVESENKATNQGISNINRADPLQPPKTQTPVPPSKAAPPVNRQPARIPPASPPVYVPANNQSPVQSPTINPQLQPSNPAAGSKTIFRLFRGCLIVVFFLIVSFVLLLFGVPFAFEAMRETQQERNNEPPRFPSR